MPAKKEFATNQHAFALGNKGLLAQIGDSVPKEKLHTAQSTYKWGLMYALDLKHKIHWQNCRPHLNSCRLTLPSDCTSGWSPSIFIFFLDFRVVFHFYWHRNEKSNWMWQHKTHNAKKNKKTTHTDFTLCWFTTVLGFDSFSTLDYFILFYVILFYQGIRW